MHNKIPDEVIEATKNNNITTRITHKKRKDGSNCSVGKQPAMVISKRHTHWFYYCFRCGMCGEIPFETNTPERTLKLIKANKTEQYKQKQKTMQLPEDFVELSNATGPAKAKTWLWSYGLDATIWKKHNIGWSDSYQRVIFPIYNTTNYAFNLSSKKLVGWLARDVSFIQSNEKVLYKVPKYLLKTEPGKTRKFFTLNAPKAKIVVVVEDILSAIKIFDAVKRVSVIALLNSSVDTSFILSNYKKHDIKRYKSMVR